MPSPVLHVAVGIGICLLDRRALQQGKGTFIALIATAAVLPDFDILPGLFVGDPNRYHNGCSHSFAFGLLTAVALASVARLLRWRVMLWAFVAHVSHCLLDMLNIDNRPPYGVPLLWPFVSDSFQASYPLFPGFRHGGEGVSPGEFLQEIVSVTNFQTVVWEVLIGLLFIAVCSGIGLHLAKSVSSAQPAKGSG